MDLNKIKYFCKVYEQNSLTQASKSLGITKSALSLSLKSLEKEVDTFLFTRTNKKMIPTGEGEFFYKKVKPLIYELSDSYNELVNLKQSFSGTIRIGAPICFGVEILRPFIQEFLQTNKNVAIDLHLEEGSKILEKLHKGHLDFAIVGEEVKESISRSIYIEKCYEYELIMTCSKKYFHKYLKGEELSLEYLKKLSLVSLPHIDLTSWVEAHYNEKTRLSSRFLVNNHHAHIDCLKNSMGIGLQASYSIQSAVNKGQLVELRPSEKKIMYPFYLIQFYDQIPTSVLRAFSEDFQSYIKKS